MPHPEYKEVGVYVGRFNPFHLGHNNVIEIMMKDFGDNHLIMIGSCNEPIGLHNPFNYKEREAFIRMCVPQVNMVGIPDYHGRNELWLHHLRANILNFTHMNEIVPDIGWADFKYKPEICEKGLNIRPVFYGGCIEELAYFISRGFKTKIINRFDSEYDMSSSKIKDSLIRGKALEGLIPSRLIHPLQKAFAERWDSFLKTPSKEV